jgi:serine/threonine protein kinase
MPLAPGTRLGPYTIVGPLGSGGMGEVYRARDTRLGRDVAIKTLPAAFASDPDRRARFESESKSIAALSHPNVLALYDIGTEHETAFAVMELIEGETLRERLADGPFTLTRALAIAIQIAQGLAAAHDRGIIHRDLKPENVILTPDSRAKILDFGLARREALTADGSRSMEPTMAMATEPGLVLGTIGYMSPEQVRGQPADARSDIFALGALLYEMLSGRRAFSAGSGAETMSAILREDPPELSRLAPDVAPAIERIVKRCLEKQATNRFRSAADLAFALEAVSSGGSGSTRTLDASAVAAASTALSFQRLTFRNGHVAGAKFTPDGAGVVYGASWEGRPFEIFSSRPGSPESRSLGLPAGSLLAISSSGEMAVSIGYHHPYWFQVAGTLARVALAGGGVRPLQKDVGHVDWAPDGRGMAIVRYMGGRCRLEYPAGRILNESAGWLSFPAISPDGRHVAYGRHPVAGDGASDLCVSDAAGASRVLLPRMTNLSGIRWSPSGREVWCSGLDDGLRHGIWSVGLDGVRREIYSSPVRITLHDVARDGRALVSIGEIRIGLNVSSDDFSREMELSWFDGSLVADLSSDGRRLLLTEADEAENPNYACYLREIDGSPAVRLGEGTGTRFSADDQWVVAVRHRPVPGLFLYPTGLGEPRAIAFEGIDHVLWAGFHADGRRLYVVGSCGELSRCLHELPIEGGTALQLWEEEIDYDWVAGLPISTDGEQVVLRRLSGEQVLFSRDACAVRPIPGLAPGDMALRFDRAGRSLFVASGPLGDRRIDRLDLESGTRSAWKSLVPPDPIGILFVGSPVVTADGSRYAYSYFRQPSNLYLVQGLG